jgi:F-type H+-transporting ATPase subunit b
MNAIVAVLVLATEAGEERSGLDLVLPDTAELLWGLIGFALLMVVLFAKVFPALNAILAERQARIQGRLEEAESIRVEAEQLRTRYQEQLADARSQANVIVDDAKGQAERVRADIIARAEEDARHITARAHEDLEAERSRLVQDLRGQVATLSVDLASRIVQRELDPARHRELVDRYITELSGMGDRTA